MEKFLNYIPVISSTAILSFLFLQFKIAVDSINMRPVERIFFTNSKKFRIYFSALLSSSLIVGPLLLIYINFIEKVPSLNENTIVYSIAFILMFFIIISIIFFILLAVVRLLSVKLDFYIYDSTKKEKWYIVKPISNSKILLWKAGDFYRFIDSEGLMNEVLVKEVNQSKPILFQNFICKNKKNVDIILYTSIAISTIMLFAVTNLDLLWRVLVFGTIVIEYLAVIYILIANNNGKMIEKTSNS
ncbi:hypothetical protein [Planococcus halotolerans]|uniref:Uncharacterized protein n=1 Tax=Planococcus halotolerans TaxID=2233542 RepID=A0A365KUD7_9BACL|nr:hypothetical protein [Planococcus halotolerans]QHJ71359.1 hypothetical protein DNR44_012300 [Planococcus halotolerans]RAZ76786.1 hypothetical protein DP120_12215 [Planococcus halotolerans]